MVETEVQRLDAKPPPGVVGEAVVEILRQEMRGRTDPPTDPLDIHRYKGLVALLMKQSAER